MDTAEHPPSEEAPAQVGTDQPPQDDLADSLPPGNSAVEIAARNGFGPLSPLATNVWHGDSRPCPSCGQLTRRAATACQACGEDLTPSMIEKMRAHCGPWYVLEHVRPFPGVTVERLLRQIRRGVLTPTTIVRGPATDHQWRYAAETPGLSKHLGCCWKCQAPVTAEDRACSTCGVDLGEASDRHPTGLAAPSAAPGGPDDNPELEQLRHAVNALPPNTEFESEAPTVGTIKASWIVLVILVSLIIALFAVVQSRETSIRSTPPAQSAPAEPASGVPVD